MSHIYTSKRKLKRKNTTVAYCLYKTKNNLKREHWTHVTSFWSLEEAERHFDNLKKYNSSYLNQYKFSLIKKIVETTFSHFSPEEMFLLKIKHGF